MGIATTLKAVTFSASAIASAQANARDLNGLLNIAQQINYDLTKTLTEIKSKLPSNDTNIAAITTILTSLS